MLNCVFSLFRKTVIDLLIVEGPNAKLKKATIIEAAKIALKREEIPMAEYNKVIITLSVINLLFHALYSILLNGRVLHHVKV